jgi:hypothetical protein
MVQGVLHQFHHDFWYRNPVPVPHGSWCKAVCTNFTLVRDQCTISTTFLVQWLLHQNEMVQGILHQFHHDFWCKAACTNFTLVQGVLHQFHRDFWYRIPVPVPHGPWCKAVCTNLLHFGTGSMHHFQHVSGAGIKHHSLFRPKPQSPVFRLSLGSHGQRKVLK